MKYKKKLTIDEKRVIEKLGSNLYTVEYIEHWINRNDDVFSNSLAALNIMAAKGYLDAVKCIVENSRTLESENLQC